VIIIYDEAEQLAASDALPLDIYGSHTAVVKLGRKDVSIAVNGIIVLRLQNAKHIDVVDDRQP